MDELYSKSDSISRDEAVCLELTIVILVTLNDVLDVRAFDDFSNESSSSK